MDLSRRLRRFRAVHDRPRARLFFARRQVGNEPQKFIRRLDELGKSALGQPEILQEHCLFFGAELGKLLLRLGAYDNDLRAVFRGVFFDLHHEGDFLLACAHVLFGDIRAVDDGFGGEEEEIVEHRLFVVGDGKGIGGLFRFEVREQFLQEGVFLRGVLVRPAARRVFDAVRAFLHRLDVRKDEFEVDGLNVAHGIDRTLDVRHVFVLETAHHVNDRVHFADMRKELVAESLAAACALHEPRNVHKFDDGGGDFFALIERGELVQPLVGNCHDADVRLDGTERIVRGVRARVRDCVEKGGFSDVRKSYDA